MSIALASVSMQIFDMQQLLLLHALSNSNKDCYAFRFGQIYVAEDNPDDHDKAMVHYSSD